MKILRLWLLVAVTAVRSAAQSTDSLDLKLGSMIHIGLGDRTALAGNDPLRAELAAGTVGGICLFERNLSKRGTEDSLRALIGALQAASRQPLWISIDEEGGKVHRLKEKYGFFSLPTAAYLGRLDNPDSTLFYNRKLAALLARLGITLNFAPSVDLAVNPANTVIVRTERSFGRSPELVARQAALCIQAHHEYGIATSLKHFPGHGSSAGDTHHGVVDVTATWKPDELAPYDSLIRAGRCDAVMVAHVVNAHWDSARLPATLSAAVVTGMLRRGLGFDGVVFSDDLQMKAIANYYGLERTIALAVNAGIDVLLFANTLPDASDRVTGTQLHALLKKLVQNGTIPMQRINESYRRIAAMRAKFAS